ncbi:MAG: NIL domain-containing protein, partial [Methylacidiphilales bacterium]|nr:NIL domain-containing protein [Candidatus Methylacidiphilales bacterium]
MTETRRLWLTFPVEAIKKPIICQLARQFPTLTFSIHNASVTPQVGIIALEIQADRPTIQQAIRWLESHSIQVEPVEINT